MKMIKNTRFSLFKNDNYVYIKIVCIRLLQYWFMQFLFRTYKNLDYGYSIYH